MRGADDQTNGMFSYLSPEQRVRADHPLRAIRAMTDQVFAELSPRFTRMYSDIGRPSIPPEQLLRALLIQSLYTVRSERLLMGPSLRRPRQDRWRQRFGQAGTIGNIRAVSRLPSRPFSVPGRPLLPSTARDRRSPVRSAGPRRSARALTVAVSVWGGCSLSTSRCDS